MVKNVNNLLFLNINNVASKFILISVVGLYIVYLIINSQNVQSQIVQVHPQFACTNCSCVNRGLVTVQQGGRLGNMIWEAASAWGFAEEYGYSLYLPDEITNNLNSVFENISIPSYSDLAKCDENFINGRKTVIISRYDMFNKDQKEWVIKNKDSNTLVVLKKYIAFFEVIVPRLQKLRDMLKFKREIIKERDDTLNNILVLFSVRLQISKNENVRFLKREEVTIVGIHVRRTDFKHHLHVLMNKTLAGPEYFHRAMDFFRNKYGKSQRVLFVIASDDPEWCIEHLMTSADVIVAPAGKSGVHDLALLSSCNHSIIDYGTYGLTAAVLAGGETIVYDLGGHVCQMMADMMPNWTVL